MQNLLTTPTIINGTDMNDLIEGTAGVDTMAGGLGDDTYVVNNWGDKIIEKPNEGTDTVEASISYYLGDNVENLTLTGTDNLYGTGNALDNTLIGNSGNNILDGAVGADTLAGGAGNDTYLVDNMGDTVTEAVNAGIDTVKSSINYILGDNVENLSLSGSDNIFGIGNTLNNTLTGNSGNNYLAGGAGVDTLIGGLGKDSLNLTESVASTDTVQIAAGDSQLTGYDVVTGFSLGNTSGRTAGVDKLDLPSTIIAANTVSTNGTDVGSLKSHQISNGIIHFGTADTFTNAVTVDSSNLSDVFTYLQSNITGLGQTVAFNTATDAYVFQDGGVNASDTLVELVGVHVSDVNTTGLGAGSLWIA